jgi:hypothetical protein
MSGFICYFLKLLNILVVLKWKYLLFSLKKRIMLINYHGPRHKMKAYEFSSWPSESLRKFLCGNSEKFELCLMSCSEFHNPWNSNLQLAKTHGLGEECDKFYAEINSTYHLCRIVWQVHKTYGKFLLFYVSDNWPLNWNDAEPSVQFLKGVPVDFVKCFDHLHHLAKVTESPLNYQDFTSLLVHRK